MLLTNLNILKDALVGVTKNTYHYFAPPNTSPPYVVWAEDGANDFIVDDKHLEIVMSGTIDLFTLDENDPLMGSIPQALNGIPCAWYLNSVQYEEDTKLIHYEWAFEV